MPECLDVERPYGELRATRTAADTIEFMEAVAKRTEGKQVHIVWDNLNTHKDGPTDRWVEFSARHGGRFHFHYTPIHGSWMNQVELQGPQRTPFEGSLKEAVALVAENFPWIVAARG